MNFFKKQKAKGQLMQAFKSGKLHLTYKNGKTEYFIMPKIHAVIEKRSKMVYVFSIPTGLDPKEIHKKKWVFQQQFGPRVDVLQENKKFTLIVYDGAYQEAFQWSYDDIAPVVYDYKLPIICGKDKNGEWMSYDMVKHPHLLIAGETGSGKSTQVRSILTTLIKTLSPDDLHMYLADMKRSEFHLFRRVEHVEKVCTKPSELMVILQKLKREAQKRGDLLDENEVMHVDDLPRKLPYVLLCIDEVALLKKDKEIMNIVEEVSSIGRALGIFLILSMQRPDAKVLDGKLKINLTVRMGFRCADDYNSRIVGTPGSEDILASEAGRMIMKLEQLQEVQAPFLEDDKAKKVLERYKVERKEEKESIREETNKNQIFGVLDE
ncbi:DNA segregation ATPase FtsK/SpoIIIE, S-DNA-T family [Alteribacillus persepolensis]|uniref:DNA segregation ATPase FtsK/SpoIIIE, S-DNA-T family n=1 Tax=Alteribacillus persepolensis TaxID=568899 RepID=A0A1G8ILF1_9BACI|nr:FtsK/SpoIIIE domain-containing protein [Alteribacillus persepolensis]SDI19713.1 DNA segregation ATPase FtsK/SpoIIIE, S-DNA-T family [Alteribacillus persepolensis]